MITTRAVPALLSVHHWRVASKATVKNDFADPLPSAPAATEPGARKPPGPADAWSAIWSPGRMAVRWGPTVQKRRLSGLASDWRK
jgi:hypothetical protein